MGESVDAKVAPLAECFNVFFCFAERLASAEMGRGEVHVSLEAYRFEAVFLGAPAVEVWRVV